MSFNLAVQVYLAVTGCLAIWMVGRKETWSRWGFVLGLASQPAWIYSAWAGEQWGILLLSLFYAYSWGQGIWNRFR